MAVDLPSGPFSLERVRVMGILDTAPDSFYRSSRRRALDQAMARAVSMVAQGADMIELSGQRTDPGEALSVDEELRRVVPVIEAIKSELPVPIAIDTLAPAVARAATHAGAEIINSVGGVDDAAMWRVAAETGAALVLVHSPGRPPLANPNPPGGDILPELTSVLLDRADRCRKDGIPDERIILDPGLGLGKTVERELALVRNLRRLTSLPYPILLAASRATFLGEILRSAPGEQLEGSLALITWGVLNGVRIVRVHDVRASKRVCLVIEAVLRPELVETGPP